jgi:hypothetical protein
MYVVPKLGYVFKETVSCNINKVWVGLYIGLLLETNIRSQSYDFGIDNFNASAVIG